MVPKGGSGKCSQVICNFSPCGPESPKETADQRHSELQEWGHSTAGSALWTPELPARLGGLQMTRTGPGCGSAGNGKASQKGEGSSGEREAWDSRVAGLGLLPRAGCPRPSAGDGGGTQYRGPGWREAAQDREPTGQGHVLPGSHGVQHPQAWLPVGTKGTVFLVPSCRGGRTGRGLQVRSLPAPSPAGPLPQDRGARASLRLGRASPHCPALAEGPCGWPPRELTCNLMTAGPWALALAHT